MRIVLWNQVKLLLSSDPYEGHPDKVCDQISDGILDAIMKQDPMSEWPAKRSNHRLSLVLGEVTIPMLCRC